MRSHFLLVSLVCLLPVTLPAQQAATRWTLTLGLAHESFHGASSDTTSLPGATVQVYPSSRLATEVGLSRRLGSWDVAISAGYASGVLRARTDLLVLDDRTTPVRRYRGAVLVGRRVISIGEASLRLIGGPVLDHWTTSGVGDQTTLGGRAGLALRVPLGPLQLENHALIGLGGSPFRKQDLPPEARIESLRTWSVGVVIRLGL